MPIVAGVVAIVDDNPFLLQALERALLAYGYRVKACASAEQYLAQADPGEIACAIIDIQLGGSRSGLDLGEEIAASGHTTPIVFMSGSLDPEYRERARQIGCIAFLEKPFLVSRLLEVIMSLDGPDF